MERCPPTRVGKAPDSLVSSEQYSPVKYDAPAMIHWRLLHWLIAVINYSVNNWQRRDVFFRQERNDSPIRLLIWYKRTNIFRFCNGKWIVTCTVQWKSPRTCNFFELEDSRASECLDWAIEVFPTPDRFETPGSSCLRPEEPGLNYITTMVWHNLPPLP